MKPLALALAAADLHRDAASYAWMAMQAGSTPGERDRADRCKDVSRTCTLTARYVRSLIERDAVETTRVLELLAAMPGRSFNDTATRVALRLRIPVSV